MKKRFDIILLFVFVLYFSNLLMANPEDAVNNTFTGNEFHRILQLDLEGSDFFRGTVFGYIVGVWVSYDFLIWESPKGMNNGQVIDIVKNYLAKHPEERHKHILGLIKKALKEKLPKAEDPTGQLLFELDEE